MYATLDISASALAAQRINLDTIAANIANVHTLRDKNLQPNPYRRRVPLFAEGDPSRGRDAPGVHIAKIVESPEPFRLVYDPTHTDAIKTGPQKGYVRTPNIDYSTEMINGIMAARMYEANVTVMEITKTMAAASLRVLA